MSKIRLMLVDDDHDFLTTAQHELKALTRIAIVGCADSGQQAVELAPVLKPDLVLMDIDLPGGMNGAQATRAIKLQPSAPKILAQSFLDASAAAELCALTGADGYVYKGEFISQLTSALNRLFGVDTDEYEHMPHGSMS